MTRLTNPWISRPETQAVCAALTARGNRALFVGGCVRNSLLGEPVNDIDLATDAPPETVIALAEAGGLKAVPTGIDHGTITVVSAGEPHEVTTFRRDVETFGRHAVIAYTDDIAEDAMRRDFTMNALYADADGTVIDPLGGLADLKARKIRFIEDARARITEDYLRILRFFRFHAWYGDPMGGLDAEGLAACADLAEGLESLSRERVGTEMLKLLSAPDPAPSVASMAAAGCLSRVLPGADAKALPMLVDLEARGGVLPNAIRRLAVLGGADVAENLRLSKASARELAQIRKAAPGTAGAAELAYRLGADLAHDAILARSALLECPVPASLGADLDAGAQAVFPVKSADLSGKFQGRALGEKLRALESEWIASGFALSKDALIG